MAPWLLLCAALLFAASGPVSRSLERLKRRRREEAHAGNIHTPRRVPLFFSALMVSFYVGYFGAGAGFLFMTMLALLGYEDIHTINALKIVANTLANGIAFIIFIADRQVVWHYGLPAMVACATGGYFSARYARRIPQRVLRTGVVVLGLAMSAWFFWHQ